jgi:hypothetical protein
MVIADHIAGTHGHAAVAVTAHHQGGPEATRVALAGQ